MERHPTMTATTDVMTHLTGPMQSITLRRLRNIVTTVLVALALAACELVTPVLEVIVDNTHTLEVVNRCLGPNATVGVYLNGNYAGSVFYSREFLVLSGPLNLRAVGTSPGGSTFTNATTVSGDLVWTLCSAGGRAAGHVGTA